MTRFLNTWLLVALFASQSCSKVGDATKRDDRAKNQGSPKNPGTSTNGDQNGSANMESASQPEVVSGAYLWGLDCRTIGDVSDTATDTSVACQIKNEQEIKFSGKLDNVVASLIVKDSSAIASGEISSLPSSQSDSFIAVFKGIKPTQVLALKSSATLDGKSQDWLVKIQTNFLTITTGPMDLYVSSSATASNVLCTRSAPCGSIARALFMIPGQIQHAVRVHIAEGSYHEKLNLSGKTITGTGGLAILGEDSQLTPQSSGMVRMTGDVTDFSSTGFLISGITGSAPSIKNFDIQGCFAYSIRIYKSSAAFANTMISDCGKDAKPLVGLHIGSGSNVILSEGFSIHGQSEMANTGIFVGAQSKVTVSDIIDIAQEVNAGLVVAEGSRVILAGQAPVQLNIAKAAIGISVQTDSSLQDYGSYNITTANPVSVHLGQVKYGISVDSASAIFKTAKIAIDLCTNACIDAGNNSMIAIGVYTTLPNPAGVASTLKMNSVDPNRLAGSHASAFLVKAIPNAKVYIYPSITQLQLCHDPDSTTPAFLSQLDARIFVGATKSVVDNLTSGCSFSSIGKIALQNGTVSYSNNITTQTTCYADEAFESCVARGQ